MKFKETKGDTTYKAKRKGFNFTIAFSTFKKRWYVIVGHSKKPVIFNSQWENISFKDIDKAKEFCESFDYTEHKFLGEDK